MNHVSTESSHGSTEGPRSTISGRVDVTHVLLHGIRRAVRIYLPADYESSQRTYPVLYLHDGHNLFDECTATYQMEWGIDETMEALGRQDPTLPAVVVGVDAPADKFERYAMYTICDWDYREQAEQPAIRSIRGTGAETAAMLTEQVKPWVEAHYRVATDRQQVAIGGSSMGGYMSLYGAARYPQAYGIVLAFSPVALDFPMRGGVLRDYLVSQGAPAAQRIYLDMGDSEHLDYIDAPEVLVEGSLRPLADALVSAGHQNVTTRVIPGGEHNEHAWGARFGEVYRWAFHHDSLAGG